MDIIGKFTDLIGGGFLKTAADTLKAYFPPSMTPEEKSAAQMALMQMDHDREIKLLELGNAMQAEFDNRVKEMEGTAKDLAGSGWPGRIIIFARGSIRPIWCYAIMYIDVMVFSGKWNLAAMQVSAGMNLTTVFWVVNLLVLGSVFGERAVQNVMPAVGAMMAKKNE